MALNRRLMRAGATLFVALAAGHVVQNGLTIPFLHSNPEHSDAGPAAAPVPERIVQLAATIDPAPKQPDIGKLELAAPVLPALASAPATVTPAPLVPPVGGGLAEIAAVDCTPSLELAAGPGAMLGLRLTAPCRLDERVVIRHAGLAVTGRTSAKGALFVSLPAMTRKADVSVLFAGGETVAASLDLPEAELYHRFGVQWMGADAFQVHAFEGGADYGEPGDVSGANPHAPGAGSGPDVGFLSVLGDDQVDTPMLAEIYSFPAGPKPVDLVVEAAVTTETCGREIIGETLSSEGGVVKVNDLSMFMPGCDAIGDYLVLKNPAQDLKLAAAN
jgi:hypothetical protein